MYFQEALDHLHSLRPLDFLQDIIGFLLFLVLSHFFLSVIRTSINLSQQNKNKTEYRGFNREGAASTQNDGPLRLVHKFMHRGSSIFSTENDDNMCPTKAWTAIDRLSII